MLAAATSLATAPLVPLIVTLDGSKYNALMSVTPSLADDDLTALMAQVERLTANRHGFDARKTIQVGRGWSQKTRRAFTADLALWLGWCDENGVDPGDADQDLLATWIKSLGGMGASERSESNTRGKKRASTTILRYLVHVGHAYRLAGLQNSLGLASLRAEVRNGDSSAKSPRPRTLPFLLLEQDSACVDKSARAVCQILLDNTRNDLVGLRDRVIIGILYDVGCSRNQLVNIEFADIIQLSDGSGLVKLDARTENRHEGCWSARLSTSTMKSINKWCAEADIRSGALVRRVNCNPDGSIREVGATKLHPNSLTLIYRRLKGNAPKY